MKQTVHDITQDELSRLLCAYISIRAPGPRREFLELVESWAKEQWLAIDNERNRRP